MNPTKNTHVPHELTMEGQIENFLRHKNDHNFVWNRDFVWGAIQHLYDERAETAVQLNLLRQNYERVVAQSKAGPSIIVATIIGLVIGLAIGWLGAELWWAL